jgi:phosphoribosyl 1,2-cyclic phosphodiesterase
MYVIGKGKRRFLIDSCIKNNLKFLHNLKVFTQTFGCYFDAVFITHGHHDHYAGAYDVVKYMEELSLPTPKVYKRITNDICDKSRLQEHPDIE